MCLTTVRRSRVGIQAVPDDSRCHFMNTCNDTVLTFKRTCAVSRRQRLVKEDQEGSSTHDKANIWRQDHPARFLPPRKCGPELSTAVNAGVTCRPAITRRYFPTLTSQPCCW